MEIKDNTFLRQFETNIDEHFLAVEYSAQDRKIFLTKLNVSDGFEDETQINEFLKNVLDLIKEQNLKVVPTASKIVSYFRRNPTYKQMLPPGILI